MKLFQYNTTGSTASGFGAGVSTGDLTNATAIGQGANVNASIRSAWETLLSR